MGDGVMTDGIIAPEFTSQKVWKGNTSVPRRGNIRLPGIFAMQSRIPVFTGMT